MWRPGKGRIDIGHNCQSGRLVIVASLATRGAPGTRALRNDHRKQIGVLTVPLRLRRCMRPRETDGNRFADVDLFAPRPNHAIALLPVGASGHGHDETALRDGSVAGEHGHSPKQACSVLVARCYFSRGRGLRRKRAAAGIRISSKARTYQARSRSSILAIDRRVSRSRWPSRNRSRC